MLKRFVVAGYDGYGVNLERKQGLQRVKWTNGMDIWAGISNVYMYSTEHL